MKTLASKEAKDRFGELLDSAQQEPVLIAKHGRPVAVLLSKAEYDRLEALEDAWWAQRAEAAAKSGYLGPAKGTALLKRLLNAKA